MSAAPAAAVPSGRIYAALPIRIDTATEEESSGRLLALADAIAPAIAADDAVTIVAGAEGVAALQVSAEQWAAELGLEPSPERLATIGDRLRHTDAELRGIEPEQIIDWEQLTPVDRQRWLTMAAAALERP